MEKFYKVLYREKEEFVENRRIAGVKNCRNSEHKWGIFKGDTMLLKGEKLAVKRKYMEYWSLIIPECKIREIG